MSNTTRAAIKISIISMCFSLVLVYILLPFYATNLIFVGFHIEIVQGISGIINGKVKVFSHR